MSDKKDNTSEGGTSRVNATHPKKGFTPQEKASVGGAFNSGVTSDDPEEKKEIEKKGALYHKQPLSDNEKKQAGKETKSGKKPNSL